jgi:hypothetical protein
MPKETKSQGKPEQVKPVAKSPPAAKAKPAARSPARAKSAADKKKLASVPEQYVFYCCDGNIFRDMEELAAGLAAMTDEAFAYHCNSDKQDFSKWVRDIIEDIELAEELTMASSRARAADCVADRIILLTQ